MTYTIDLNSETTLGQLEQELSGITTDDILSINLSNDVPDIFSFKNLSIKDNIGTIELNLKEDIETLGTALFSSLTNLKEFKFRTNGYVLKGIGTNSFMACGNLTNIVIPEGVIIIGLNCFANCANLATLILPSTLKNIYAYTFRYCQNLKDITYYGDDEGLAFGLDAFALVPAQYVKVTSVYKSTSFGPLQAIFIAISETGINHNNTKVNPKNENRLAKTTYGYEIIGGLPNLVVNAEYTGQDNLYKFTFSYTDEPSKYPQGYYVCQYDKDGNNLGNTHPSDTGGNINLNNKAKYIAIFRDDFENVKCDTDIYPPLLWHDKLYEAIDEIIAPVYYSEISAIIPGWKPIEPYYSPEEVPNGVYVYANDGLLYTPSEWDTNRNDDAVGVAVVTDNSKFCMGKFSSNDKITWSISLSNTNIPEISEDNDDYKGLNNSIIIRQYAPSENETNNAAWYCYLQTITINGNTIHGYLPATGEFSDAYYYKNAVENALNLIGGTVMPSDSHWASTEDDMTSGNNTYAYGFKWDSGSFVINDKNIGYMYVRPFYPILPTLVDLGLPSGTLWSTTNLGALKPEDGGYYYQWGDTIGWAKEEVENGRKKFASDWSDYKFGSSGNFSKYNSTDEKTILDLEDDAAYIMFGNEWRMPTKDDFVELCQNTDMFVVPESGEEVAVTVTDNSSYPIHFNFTPVDKAKAFKFYKKGDHSSYIYVPFVGNAYDGSVLSASEGCYLWSSSLVSGGVQDAFYWGCGAPDGDGYVNDGYRYSGFPVRPVYKPYNSYIDLADTKAGDICVAYPNGDKKFLRLGEEENTFPEYVTPIGVVVVPASHNVYGDGSCGVMSLKSMSCVTPETGSMSEQGMYWGDYGTDISTIPNLNQVPTGNQVNGLPTGQTSQAYLPSDKLINTQCAHDTDVYYNNSPCIPSPYLTDGIRNPGYYQTTSPSSTNNCLADFDGRGNTDKIITQRGNKDYSSWKPTYNDGADYPAASCCNMFYTDGTNQGDWYLPACGELGYIIPPFNKINEAITKMLNTYGISVGVKLNASKGYWSSSEYDSGIARYVYTYNGRMNYYNKDTNNNVRAFLRVGPNGVVRN